MRKVYILCSAEGCEEKLHPSCSHLVFANVLAKKMGWFRIKDDDTLWLCPKCKKIMTKHKKKINIVDPPFIVETG